MAAALLAAAPPAAADDCCGDTVIDRLVPDVCMSGLEVEVPCESSASSSAGGVTSG